MRDQYVKLIGASIVFSWVCVGVANAQDCGQILSAGIVDRARNYDLHQRTLAMANSQCDRTDANAVVPGYFQGSYNQKLCRYGTLNEAERREVQSFTETVSPLIVSAWQSCISAPGFHVWTEWTNDPDLFSIHFKFVPPANCTEHKSSGLYRCASETMVHFHAGGEGYPRLQCNPSLDTVNNTPISDTVTVQCRRLGPGSSLIVFSAGRGEVAPRPTKLFIPGK